MAEEPSITFKFIKNVVGLIFDGRSFAPRVEMRELPTQHGNAAVPYFFMDELQTVPLKNEKVMIPRKPHEMSERRYESMKDKAYDLAESNTAYNTAVRASLALHVECGDIEIIDDPFALETHEDYISETELDNAVKMQQAELAAQVEAAAELAHQQKIDEGSAERVGVEAVANGETTETKLKPAHPHKKPVKK